MVSETGQLLRVIHYLLGNHPKQECNQGRTWDANRDQVLTLSFVAKRTGVFDFETNIDQGLRNQLV